MASEHRGLDRWLAISALVVLAACAQHTAPPTATDTAIETLVHIATATPTRIIATTPSQTPTRSVATTSTIGPTQTPFPSPSLTALPSDTPSPVAWLVAAEELDWWPKHVFRAWWDTPNTITVVAGESIHAEITDSGTRRIESTPLSAIVQFDFLNSSDYSTSPEETYVVECLEGGLILYHVGEQLIVSQTSVTLADCDYAGAEVSWAPDEHAIAFISGEREIYLWETTGTLPRLLGTTTILGLWPTWAPDSEKFLVADFVPGYADAWTFTLYYSDGRPLVATGAQIGTRAEWPPSWFTADIVVHNTQCGAGCSVTAYYDAYSGKELASYLDDGFITEGRLSPDGRWLIMSEYGGPPYEGYDFQTRTAFVLEANTQGYSFLNWSPDSASFFVIRRPLSHSVPWVNTRTPGTLLALDPATRQFEALLSDVVYAQTSSSGRQLFAIRAEEQSDGSTVMMGATYDRHGVQTGVAQPFGPWPIPDRIWENSSLAVGDNGPFRAWWSPEEHFVVVMDWQGVVALLGSTFVQPLTTGFPLEPWPYLPSVAWAPDEQHILITSPARAWIIRIP